MSGARRRRGERFAPDLPLPPYAYVPGGPFPHPSRDPRGRRHGRTDADFGPAPTARSWRRSRMYSHALDLLNHGYYWEAHEAFEKWWKETPENDPRRALFHGLLRLAAAGVKAREGRPHGVVVHARRAAALIRQTAAQVGVRRPRLLGLELGALAAAADGAAERAATFRARSSLPAVDAVLGIEFELAQREK